ncbi:MAG: hypothetical protein ACK53Y_06085, partial [bacterium]
MKASCRMSDRVATFPMTWSWPCGRMNAPPSRLLLRFPFAIPPEKLFRCLPFETRRFSLASCKIDVV